MKIIISCSSKNYSSNQTNKNPQSKTQEQYKMEKKNSKNINPNTVQKVKAVYVSKYYI